MITSDVKPVASDITKAQLIELLTPMPDDATFAVSVRVEDPECVRFIYYDLDAIEVTKATNSEFGSFPNQILIKLKDKPRISVTEE